MKCETDRRTETERRNRDKLVRELGAQIMEALQDGSVSEICLNEDGSLWIERLRHGMQRVGTMDAVRAEMVLTTVASALHAEITRHRPSIEGELPLEGNPRIAGSIPPKTTAPQFTIRKPALRIYTLDDYVSHGALCADQRTYLAGAIEQRKNIIVAGGTGSGKTTLTNALIADLSRLCPADRLLILEDTREIQCASPNSVRFRTTPAESMDALVKSCMRHRPDRIIVGEVRDGAALAMLEAWNTGHEGGICTIHARNSHAQAALLRLEYLTQKAHQGNHRTLIGEAVDLIITIERRPDGTRRIATITEVRDYERETGKYITHTVFHHSMNLIKGA